MMVEFGSTPIALAAVFGILIDVGITILAKVFVQVAIKLLFGQLTEPFFSDESLTWVDISSLPGKQERYHVKKDCGCKDSDERFIIRIVVSHTEQRCKKVNSKDNPGN